MRLCFVTPEYPTRPPFGGIATYVQVVAQWLVEHGHEVHVLCSSREAPWKTEMDRGVSVSFVPPRRVKPRRILRYAARLSGMEMLQEAYYSWDRVEDSIGTWSALQQLAQERPFDIIELADTGALGWWGLIRPFRQTPTVLRGHFLTDMGSSLTEWPGSRFQYWMEQQCARRADLVLTNSAHLAHRYHAECQVPMDRVCVLPLGFRMPDTNTGPLKRYEHLTKDPFVLFVGWLDPIKGVDVLLRAMRLVRAQQPAVRVVMAGAVTSRFKSAFEVLSREAGGVVHHIGTLSQEAVFSLMQQATVVVMPSRVEPLGRVAVEAQLCGCPVVASNVGGLPEVVEDGVTGLLVPPEDVKALAEAILALVACPGRAAEMGNCAQTRARDKYEVSRIMNRQLQWYQFLLGKEIGNT